MPLVSIECCEETFSLVDVLKDHLASRRNRCHLTYELGQAILETSTAHPSHEDPSRISTTVLTSKCLRSTVLERFTDTTSTFDDLWASFRGTMFHGQMEKYAAPGSYGEARFYVTDLGEQIPAIKKLLPGKKTDRSFSGSPDLVDPLAGILYDYKRTKEVPRWNTAWPDHVSQNNINRWLVDFADYIEVKFNGKSDFPTTGIVSSKRSMDLTGIVRYDLQDPGVRERFVPVEWQELVIVYVDDKGPKPITVTQSIDVPKVGGVGTKKARVADVWSDEQVESYITERFVQARTALTAHIAPIPVGWEEASHVLCGYCSAREKCLELQHAEPSR